MKRFGVLAVLVLLFGNCTAVAQVASDFAIQAVPSDAEIALGESYTLKVSFSSASPGILAWSFGLCVDRNMQEVLSAVPGSDFNSLRFGGPPEWWAINAEAQGGVTQAVMLDLRAAGTLGVIPETDPLEVLDVVLRPTDNAADKTVTVAFCDTAGTPPVATLFSVGSSGISPATKTPSSVTVVRDPATLLAYTSDLYRLLIAPNATVETVVRARSTSNLYGFSFGVAHDAAVLTVENVTVAPELRVALGSAANPKDPEFFQVDLAPAHGSGFTVGVVFQTSTPVPPATDLLSIKSTAATPSIPVIVAEYSLTPGAPADVTTPLTIVGTLGEPPVVILFDTGREVTPTSRPCEVQVSTEIPKVAFTRGDINADGNLNISDAIMFLRYLFSGGSLTFDCLDALNCNGDESINVGDVVYLLGYQFGGGPPPPAPFSTCGTLADGATTVGCNSFPPCQQ